MIPLIIAAIGGYFIGDSRKESFAVGGNVGTKEPEYHVDIFYKSKKWEGNDLFHVKVKANSEQEAKDKAAKLFVEAHPGENILTYGVVPVHKAIGGGNKEWVAVFQRQNERKPIIVHGNTKDEAIRDAMISRSSNNITNDWNLIDISQSNTFAEGGQVFDTEISGVRPTLLNAYYKQSLSFAKQIGEGNPEEWAKRETIEWAGRHKKIAEKEANEMLYDITTGKPVGKRRKVES